MRVLHVYSGNLYGGIEVALVTMARHRDLCPEMEPHFALCFEGRLSKELEATGTSLHQLGNVRASHPRKVWRARRKLKELLKQTRYDVVICHAPWPQAIFGPVARNAELPLIFWMHGETDGKHWTERWARLTPPNLAICNSRFTASMLAAIYPQSRAEVLYYPVVAPTDRSSKEERRAIRAEFETSFDATVIVQVSRMEGLKGHTPHLEALGGMKNLPGWVCWLVGGPQRPQEVAYNNELRALAESLGISERVRFIGERSDVTKVLDAADIYCQPNLRPDAFGISFIEAFDAGLPVVTSNLGGALEVVTDSCGILVPPGDVTALADVLRKLINDEGLRRTLGATGRTRARKLCDPNTQLRKLYELLSSVMKRDQYLNQG